VSEAVMASAPIFSEVAILGCIARASVGPTQFVD